MINEEIKDAVSNGKLNTVTSVVMEALEKGAGSEEVLDSMITAMDEVGEKFQNNDIYVPEMLTAAKTMEKGVAVLKPRFSSSGVAKSGKVIIGTVAGDLHDIGKNLVSIMMQASGLEVIDLGIDVPPEEFVKALKQNPDCDIVALSALLTFTLDSLRETVEYIRNSKAGKKVTIMVGGAPVTDEYAKMIGADIYTKDAVAAAKAAKAVCDKKYGLNGQQSR
ncbi:MAG: cobalamin-dependent protein [Firmicutes bacterium]|jgi:methanogenic corrinoid protein MtbC1|nr:cobalamin-dependent protein [Bacillota bacterium]